MFQLKHILWAIVLGGGAVAANAQALSAGALKSAFDMSGHATATDLAATPVALPRMAPELALVAYSKRTQYQHLALAAYSDTTIVKAELPSTAQAGEYELERSFAAPHSLAFKKVKFEGDTFVKTNVIAHVLQSEVDYVAKGDPTANAIDDRNYKFNYKGTDTIDGREVHVFQIKPRKKVPGLFKGKIYLDSHTGALARVEGTMVKSPSFWVKNLEFVQDYGDFGEFTLPTYLRSVAKARIIGKAIVTVLHRGYQPVSSTSAATSNVLVRGGGQPDH